MTLLVYLPGYVWFGNNRKYIHVNAGSGSGGVGFLVNQEFTSSYSISIIDDKNEDHVGRISRQTYRFILLCMCLISSLNSSRHVDAAEFYDTLLSDIYLYQNSGPLFVTGDFNSRIGL